MDTTPLCVFVTKVTASDRMVFGDLRRLQRDVLPAGAATREEIETLLSLDSLGQVDDDWPGYLVATVKDFVLSTSDPPGSVDADTAAWLVTALSNARPRSAAAILRAVLSEAQHTTRPSWHSAGEGRSGRLNRQRGLAAAYELLGRSDLAKQC